jgi:CDP-glycerol glycerophosphotransferase (TagB/SpsB family)
MDPAWPHLQGIYEFFLQLVINESVEVKCLKVYVTPQFVQEFLDLFDSEESVERDYLKNILHKLYAKVSNSCNVEMQRVSMSVIGDLSFNNCCNVIEYSWCQDAR